MTLLVDKKLSERFEVAFNQIHSWLQKSMKDVHTDKFTELLRLGFPLHSIIRQNYHDLRMYARLRNSIVHEKVEEGFYIAEPHERVVEKIENIAAHIFQPKSALAIATKPVFYYHEDAKLKDVLTVIKKRSYSIFPIYDQTGFKWLLTADCIIQCLAEHLAENTIDINQLQVSDLFQWRKPLPVEFVSKEADMFAVEEIFENYHLKNKKLEAVIITESGSMTEKPLGIVTSWDLVEIDTMD